MALLTCTPLADCLIKRILLPLARTLQAPLSRFTWGHLGRGFEVSAATAQSFFPAVLHGLRRSSVFSDYEFQVTLSGSPSGRTPRSPEADLLVPSDAVQIQMRAIRIDSLWRLRRKSANHPRAVVAKLTVCIPASASQVSNTLPSRLRIDFPPY